MSSNSTASSAPQGWEPPLPEELQKMLPQYEITGILGRGGMGAVYKGIQKNLDREVAIKVLPETLAEGNDDMNFVARFKLEAKAMAKLNHPAILSVHDFGETSEGQLFFVMEFVDGMDIQDYLKEHGGILPQEHALSITAHVLDALEYAHSNGIVHRDIKPANILLNNQGQVKIADFGLAKALPTGGEEEEPALTMTHMAVGTPDFVAPEALDCDGIPDHRADIYAVGVMLYRMLTGSLPRGQFKLPSEMRGELDPRLDNVVSLALQTDPDDRYSSASDLRMALDPVITSPMSRVQMVQQQEEETRAMQIAQEEETQAIQRKQAKGEAEAKSKKKMAIGITVAAVLAVGGLIAFVMKSGDKESEGIVSSAPKSSEPKESSPSKGKPIDLLAAIDPAVHTILGDWKREGDGLLHERPKGVRSGKALIYSPVPITDPSNYALSMSFIPLETAQGTNFIFPVADRFAELIIGGWGNTERGPVSGLSRIEEKDAPGNKTGVFDHTIDSDRTYTAEIRVAVEDSEAEIEVDLNGEPFVRWAGSLKSLTLSPSVEGGETIRAGGPRVYLFQLAGGMTRFTELSTTLRAREALSATDPGKIPESTSQRKSSQSVTSATKTKPFENRLGMKFVPVPMTGGPSDGKSVLFSIWETRVKDYAAFIEENKGHEWPKPDFKQSDDHPAVSLNWEDAQAFCEWLTKEDQRNGKLGKNEHYRLPTDHEWSCAVGLGKEEDPELLPSAKDRKIADIYPWGKEFPPPKGAGNYYGEEMKRNPFKNGKPIEGYDDGFDRTAPVGSFEANENGLYDMGGNVWEWCEDWYSTAKETRVLRGASWNDGMDYDLGSSRRNRPAPSVRRGIGGFRVVKAGGG